METADAVVVGGGPAGSTCAWKLRAAGLEVLVLDKAAFPRDKPCAGWVTPQVFEELGIDREEYLRSGRTLQAITAFRTGLIGGQARETAWERPVSWGIRRCEFDTYLLERSGARLSTGTALSSIRREGRQWIVNETFAAPLVIGAGGHFCPVARFLNGDIGPEAIVAAQELELKLDESQSRACGVAGEVPELWFCRDLRGYGWCFRKGAYLNIGLGREDRNALPRHLSEFVDFLKTTKKIPFDLHGDYKGHAYLLGPASKRRVAADGMLLVGDAAGLAWPESGEGIRTAVESGLLAARVVVDASGDYGVARLEPYVRALGERFGKRGRLRPSRRLPGPIAAALASALMASRWFARRVLLERWFLRMRMPPLVTLSASWAAPSAASGDRAPIRSPRCARSL
jgi:geranylgeranyl reductase family protein